MRGVMVLALVACGGSVKHAAIPTVELVDAGAEPRVQLRYAPPPNSSARVENTTKLRTTSSVTNTVLETTTEKTDLPGIKLMTLFETGAVDPDGSFLASYRIYDVIVLDDVVDPKVRMLVESKVPALRGLHASWRQSALGEITGVTVEGASSGQLGDLRRTLEEPPVRFPEGPVGIGAHWKTTDDVEISGVTWTRSAVYTLVALTDATASIDVDVDIKAMPQALTVSPKRTIKVTSGRETTRSHHQVSRHGLAVTGSSQGSEEVRLSIVSGPLRLTKTLATELSQIITAPSANNGDQ